MKPQADRHPIRTELVIAAIGVAAAALAAYAQIEIGTHQAELDIEVKARLRKVRAWARRRREQVMDAYVNARLDALYDEAERITREATTAEEGKEGP